MFGNNKPFGTASTFGSSTFGSTTPFGQSNTTFGAKPATGNVFGSSAFGSTAPAGSLFGSATPSTGTGLFGQTSTAFGQPASTSGVFGATSTSGGLFGTTTPATQQSSGLFGGSSTSAFGAPRPAFGGFGTPSTGTGLFGQTTNTATGLFGSTTGFAMTASSGTTVKFNPPTGTDTMMKSGVSQNINTRHQCITCMKEYENKSLEELRLEDYLANRKGPQAGGTIGGFGPTAPQTGGLFGTPAASTSAFSFGTTQAKPLFGTTGATNTFGTTGTGMFGQTTQAQNTGIFGKPVGFGTPTTSSTSGFVFGNTGGTSLFGQANQQKPLFGQPTAGTGLFGQPAATQASTGFGTGTGFGTFGATTQPSTGLFGAKPTGFGTTNTTTTSTFNFGPSTGGGLFGQKPATPAFGTGTGFGATTAFGPFGSTQASTTGLFGQTKPATTGFGTTGSTFGTGLGTNFGTPFATTGLNTNTGTGLFGSSLTNKTAGFSFGATGGTGFGFGQPVGTGTSFNFGATPGVGVGSDPNAANILQQQQLQAQQVFAFTANPFGDNPLFRNTLRDSRQREDLLKPTNPAAQKAILTNNQFKVSPLPTSKLKPKPITSIPNGKVSLFDGLEDEDSSLGNTTFVPKRNIKKLVLKTQAATSSSFTVTSSILSSSSRPTEINVSTSIQVGESPKRATSQRENTPSPLTVEISESSASPETSVSTAPVESRDSSPLVRGSLYIPRYPSDTPIASPTSSINDTIQALHTQNPKPDFRAPTNESAISDQIVSSSSTNQPALQDGEGDERVSSVLNPHPTGICLKRPGYYTQPSMDDIVSLLDENGNCFVQNFTVGREGFGKVVFPGVTNVANLNLDEIVHFQRKEITVYPDDSNKPPQGEGLNREAEITLDCVWPTDKTSRSPIKDPERLTLMGYRDKIEKSTARLGARFIEYRPETGSWVFQVDHFSKYGLEDSDDESDPKALKAKSSELPKQVQILNGVGSKPSSAAAKQSLLSKKLRAAADDDDDEMRDADIVPESDNFYSPLQQLVTARVDAEQIQGMKASFFLEHMEENWALSNDVQMEETAIPQFQFSFQKSSNAYIKPIPIKKTITQTMGAQYAARQYNYYEEPKTPAALSTMTDDYGEQTSKVPPAISTVRTEILSACPMLSPLALKSSELMSFHKVISGKICKIASKPFSESLVYGKERNLADTGFFMGRSFRVGWGPNGTLLHLGQIQGSVEPDKVMQKTSLFGNFSLANNMSTTARSDQVAVSLSKVQFLSTTEVDDVIKQNLVESLEVQLQNSASALEDGSPIFVPKPGIQLIHDHAELSKTHLQEIDPSHMDSLFIKQYHHIWELCVALWGNIPALELELAVTPYAVQIARREALSQWLIATTKEELQSELNNNSFEHAGYLSNVFSYMTGRKIYKAAVLAQDNGDHSLATVIAQAEGPAIVRRLIATQLHRWEQSGAYKMIKHQRLKLYGLLAGVLYWNTSTSEVNCCENLDWRRTLALHLWYYCSPTASVQEVVSTFEKSFKGPEAIYTYPPVPPYMNQYPEESLESSSIYDTCYHLLKLDSDRSHRLDKLLMPETSTSSHLDYRLSWILHNALLALGFSHLSPDAACTLHFNFASQLESVGLWQWSVFVVLHLPNSERRISCVKDLLLRHLTLDHSEETEAKESFLQEKLLIPQEWIFEAKAIKSHSFGQPADEAYYLLKAGYWSKSHEIIVKHLASDAIINEKYDYLLKFLQELSPVERSSTIIDWANGGQVFLDYIHISQLINRIVQREVSAYDIEKLQPEVISLCYRLSGIRCPTAKDRLCQSEMAKKTATLLRTVLTLQADKSGTTAAVFTLAPHIKNLPMPEDYSVLELRALTCNYLLTVASE